MFEDMETANKRQKPLVEIEAETSVFDFIEEEEDRPASCSRPTTETFCKSVPRVIRIFIFCSGNISVYTYVPHSFYVWMH
jgi:hypothetical protein